MPMHGPSDGSRIAANVFLPSLLSACASPIVVVVLPSPAGVGFIALFGVAVLNGILMINHFIELSKRNKYRMTTMNIIRKGTPHLLRPVFLTGLVASLGFVPMAIAATAGAEVQRPLATVVIGGLIVSTILTLIIIPVFYYLINSSNAMMRKFFK